MKYLSEALLGSRVCEAKFWAWLVLIMVYGWTTGMIMISQKMANFQCILELLKAVSKKDRLDKFGRRFLLRVMINESSQVMTRNVSHITVLCISSIAWETLGVEFNLHCPL